MKKSYIITVFLLILSICASAFFMDRILDYSEAREVIAYRQGSTGNGVREIQERLSKLDLYNGAIDGIYGPATTQAVRDFQRQKGLTIDGIAGNMTLEALGIITSESIYEDDLYLLASVIYGEGRGEPYEGQVAIGAVVLNRVESEVFPNSVYEVVFQNGAFSAVNDGQIYLGVDETAINAARDALNGADPTGGALYYWNPATATSQWIWSIPIETAIGRHVFGGSA
ncbi:MAG: spore cortex-lytic enzyme [Firmicutes bacterium]|nr:spore cortex-lytic enzyme [Bacillota bacterium]